MHKNQLRGRKGLRARGNFTVVFEWKAGKVTRYSIVSPNPFSVQVRDNGKVKTVRAEKQ